MNKSEIIRIPLFVLFFSIGASALGLSVLCEDLVRYFRNVQVRESARQAKEKLEILNEDYGSVIKNISEDPNYITRIAPVVGGSQYKDPNAILPKETAQEMAAARRAFGQEQQYEIEPVLPEWLSRSCETEKRLILFFSGIALMMISFVCFRPLKV